MFVRVLLHNAALHLNALPHHVLQGRVVGLGEVEGHVLGPHGLVAQQGVLQHFGVARTQVFAVEGLQEGGVDAHRVAFGKGADFIFQPLEIDARFASHRRVDHAQQRGGHVQKAYAALEGGRGKTAQVCHHAAAQVHQHAVARGAALAQGVPHLLQRADVLVLVGGRYDDVGNPEFVEARCQQGAAQAVCGFVGEQEDAVGPALAAQAQHVGLAG